MQKSSVFYLLVDPNPPNLSPSAQSLSATKNLWNIACPIASPFFISLYISLLMQQKHQHPLDAQLYTYHFE